MIETNPYEAVTPYYLTQDQASTVRMLSGCVQD